MSINLAPPPGFQGLDENKPIRFYTRHLPHWRQDGATYFVTFRLCDSLPQSKLAELRALRDAWKRRHPPPQDEADWQTLLRSTTERVERWLDEGMGACWLKDPALAVHVTEAMHHFDGHRYELDSYVVMPNHVHAIVRPTFCDDHPLEKIVGSWKQFATRKLAAAVASDGPLFQQECFDKLLRDEEHLYRTLQYIGRNPSKAGLARDACPTWVRPSWKLLGWRFEEDGLPRPSRNQPLINNQT